VPRGRTAPSIRARAVRKTGLGSSNSPSSCRSRSWLALEKDPGCLEGQAVPVLRVLDEREAEAGRDLVQGLPGKLPVPRREGAPQDSLGGLLAGGHLAGGRLGPGGGRGARRRMRGDLESRQRFEHLDLIGPQVVHRSLRHQGEGQVEERREAHRQDPRFGGDMRAKRKPQKSFR
jgi:hypothetical protein